MDLFSFLLLTILSTTCIAIRRSMKYLKSAPQPYALPISVCYPREIGDMVESVILNCTLECSPPNEDGEQECDKSVMAFHYASADCSGDVVSFDRFSPNDRRGEYPYNCFEREEFEGNEVNEEDYAQSYMILRVSHGKMVTETINGTEEEVCVRDESETFYRTFPAITNLCVKGYEGNGANRKYYWYYAVCNENAAYLERWDEYNCTGQQTGAYPIYKPNGCDHRTWGNANKHWYTEVMECSHKDYTIGEGFRNCNNIIVAIVFIFIVTFM